MASEAINCNEFEVLSVQMTYTSTLYKGRLNILEY